MKLGCFLSLLLLPVLIALWIKKETKRRAAMSPEERKLLEDEEKYGKIDETIECIYCHQTKCVRTTSFTDSIGSPALIFSEENVKKNMFHTAMNPARGLYYMANDELSKTAEMLKARCMSCNAYWDMFDPEGE